MTESKRAKITEENRQESARLKALWDDGREHRTQTIFGEAFGLGNQANVGHYLHGRSALNQKAAIAFAAELRCRVADFSPRIQEEIDLVAPYATQAAASPNTPATPIPFARTKAEGQDRWPFPGVDQAKIRNLKGKDRRRLEIGFLYAAAQLNLDVEFEPGDTRNRKVV